MKDGVNDTRSLNLKGVKRVCVVRTESESRDRNGQERRTLREGGEERNPESTL